MSAAQGKLAVAVAAPAAGSEADPNETQRLDKWLWFARVIKTRSLATKLVAAGKVRVNRVKCDKPSQPVRHGDVITATIGRNVRVLKVLAAGKRRGPAPEAQALYEDLAPLQVRAAPGEKPADRGQQLAGGREPGSGRPTKRERRQTDKLKSAEPGEA